MRYFELLGAVIEEFGEGERLINAAEDLTGLQVELFRWRRGHRDPDKIAELIGAVYVALDEVELITGTHAAAAAAQKRRVNTLREAVK